jgi:hypothetical protein
MDHSKKTELGVMMKNQRVKNTATVHQQWGHCFADFGWHD